MGLNPALAVRVVDVRRISRNRRLDLVRRHEPLGHSCQRPALQFLAPDRPAVGAGTATMLTGTAIAVSDDDRIHAAADTAFEKAPEQLGGPPSTMQGARPPRLLNHRVAPGKPRLPGLHRCPAVLIPTPILANRAPQPTP